ncbi:MAG: hypothetical protein VX802_06405, partial [Pseudomonadota bacterium]|nr:hypothetical protein [Pseudomonadota bacterium]
ETVDVRIETGEAGDVSLVLQSSAGPITADIDFESSIQGQSGNLQINTVALPDEIAEGDTLELTVTVNTPTGTQTVTLQQTLDAGETLQDAAAGLVADLSTLTDGQGNPLGLSGEMVTVEDEFGGVQTSLQLTAPQGSNLNTVELPDQLDPGETLELTLTVNTPTGTQTVTLSQTRDEDETLQDAAEGLVEDLAALTDGQGNPLGLSGELVQVTIPGGTEGTEGTEGTPVPSIQSIQITAPQGSNLNTVELSVGAEIAAQSSIVQTDEHVATVAIPSDVGDLSQSAQLDVSIAGPGFPLDAEGNPGIGFQFDIAPGQTPQNVADQLLNEIQNRLG